MCRWRRLDRDDDLGHAVGRQLDELVAGRERELRRAGADEDAQRFGGRVADSGATGLERPVRVNVNRRGLPLGPCTRRLRPRCAPAWHRPRVGDGGRRAGLVVATRAAGRRRASSTRVLGRDAGQVDAAGPLGEIGSRRLRERDDLRPSSPTIIVSVGARQDRQRRQHKSGIPATNVASVAAMSGRPCRCRGRGTALRRWPAPSSVRRDQRGHDLHGGVGGAGVGGHRRGSSRPPVAWSTIARKPGPSLRSISTARVVSTNPPMLPSSLDLRGEHERAEAEVAHGPPRC